MTYRVKLRQKGCGKGGNEHRESGASLSQKPCQNAAERSGGNVSKCRAEMPCRNAPQMPCRKAVGQASGRAVVGANAVPRCAANAVPRCAANAVPKCGWAGRRSGGRSEPMEQAGGRLASVAGLGARMWQAAGRRRGV